jgi:hypothetical protein
MYIMISPVRSLPRGLLLPPPFRIPRHPVLRPRLACPEARLCQCLPRSCLCRLLHRRLCRRLQLHRRGCCGLTLHGCVQHRQTTPTRGSTRGAAPVPKRGPTRVVLCRCLCRRVGRRLHRCGGRLRNRQRSRQHAAQFHRSADRRRLNKKSHVPECGSAFSIVSDRCAHVTECGIDPFPSALISVVPCAWIGAAPSHPLPFRTLIGSLFIGLMSN